MWNVNGPRPRIFASLVGRMLMFVPLSHEWVQTEMAPGSFLSGLGGVVARTVVPPRATGEATFYNRSGSGGSTNSAAAGPARPGPGRRSRAAARAKPVKPPDGGWHLNV